MPTVPADDSPELAQYSKPELLVTTNWLAEHLNDPGPGRRRVRRGRPPVRHRATSRAPSRSTGTST